MADEFKAGVVELEQRPGLVALLIELDSGPDMKAALVELDNSAAFLPNVEPVWMDS